MPARQEAGQGRWAGQKSPAYLSPGSGRCSMTRARAAERCGAGAELASRGRGYRSLEVDGFEVLVGKGDAANDALTFDVAEPHDLWLHVAGPAGSHVVIRNPERLDEAELPRAVLERAAEDSRPGTRRRAARRARSRCTCAAWPT